MANAFQATIFTHDRLGLQAQLAQGLRVRAAETGLDGRRRAGADHQPFHLGKGLQVLFANQLAGGRQGRIDLLPLAHLNNQLGIAGVTLFRVVGQHEALGATTDGAGHPGDLVHFQQRRLKALHRFAGGTDVTALGQPVIHQKHGCIGGREEGLFNRPEAYYRHYQQNAHAGQGQHAMMNGPVQQAPIDHEQFALVGIFALPASAAHILVGEKQVRKERHQGHRGDPAEQQ